MSENTPDFGEPWYLAENVGYPFDRTGAGCAHPIRLARIVACVNALAGIPDPAAFVEQAKRLTAERDEAIRQRDAKDRILNIVQYADTTMTVGELLLQIATLIKEPRP